MFLTLIPRELALGFEKQARAVLGMSLREPDPSKERYAVATRKRRKDRVNLLVQRHVVGLSCSGARLTRQSL